MDTKLVEIYIVYILFAPKYVHQKIKTYVGHKVYKNRQIPMWTQEILMSKTFKNIF